MARSYLNSHNGPPRILRENANIAYQGVQAGKQFVVSGDAALKMLQMPNPSGMPNSDVLVPWADDGTAKSLDRGQWVIDFGNTMTEAQSAAYCEPFDTVRKQQGRPLLAGLQGSGGRTPWRHQSFKAAMRAALRPLPRYLATALSAQERAFVWLPAPALPDRSVVVFARDDDYFFGVMQSRFHRLWSAAMVPTVGYRYIYQIGRSFETFPMPWVPSAEPRGSSSYLAISGAAENYLKERKRLLAWPDGSHDRTIAFPASPSGPWRQQSPNRDSAPRTATHAYTSGPPGWPFATARSLFDIALRSTPEFRTATQNLDLAVAQAYAEVIGCQPHEMDDEKMAVRILGELARARSDRSG